MTILTRPEIEAIFLQTLRAGEISPCESAAITEAFEHAGAYDTHSNPDAQANHYLIAAGFEQLADDLTRVAEAIRDKGGTL